MEILHPCCTGLDGHKRTVVACGRRIGPDGQVHTQVRTFGTLTAELLQLADWRAAEGVRQVAMESTGVSWKPVYHLLEGRFELLLVNARPIKNVPGRKTDVTDAEWIAQLLQHGRLQPSFVPPAEIREWRDLTRQRAQLIHERATGVNRVPKGLEDAHIKRASVATDVLGQSGRALIAALIAGETDPDPLAERARGSLRKKRPELRRAPEGRVTEPPRFLLRTLMRQEEQWEGLIAQDGARIEEVMTPFAEATARLRRIPGIGTRAAAVIVAEIGTDLEKFPTAGHLGSWAGLGPGNDPSAGKHRSGRTTKGSRWLRATLVPVAWAAIRTKETIFQVVYRRWAKRLGRKKALVAVGHKILSVISSILKNQTDYRERWTPGQAA